MADSLLPKERLTLAAAQQLAVIRVPGFLNTDEVDAIHELAASLCGAEVKSKI